MSEERWAQLQALFEGALERPESERNAWLDAACGDDGALRDELRGLLEADASEDDPLRQAVDRTVRELDETSQRASGQAIGPWRILRELGSGGMGSVYLAERGDAEYQRQVAVKLIRGFPDAQSLERLRQERQILADLEHPNIAAMLDGGTTEGGQPYLVMQFVDGQPLDRWCASERLPRRQRLALMQRICSAVEYAHQKLIIHRDLKPGNVMVTPAGEPMLLDFGIAKLASDEAQTGEAGAMTRSGRYFTPGFSPPEQLRGESVSTLADVYGLGKLLEWLMTRDLAPGEGDCPRELMAIIARATANELRERYPSVATLRQDIERYLEGRPVEAAAPRWGYRLGKFIKRHAWATAAVALALIVAVGLVSRILVESERAHRAEAEARLEAANANQVLDFLVDMIDAAGPARARGEEVRVLDVIDLASERASPQSVDDPALRARLLFALGRLYRTMEAQVPAMELLAESARLARETGDLATEVEALSMLGVSATLDDELGRAEAALLRAVELARSNPQLAPLLQATALNNYGVFLNEAGRLDEAREALERALEIRRSNGAPARTIATSLHNLAETEDIAGRPSEARALFEQALEMKEQSIGRLHLSYARSLNGLSMTAGQLGDLETAQRAMQEHLEIRQTLLGEDHHSLWRDYNELAWQQHDLGYLQEAIDLYQRAREHDARSPGGAARDWLFTNNMAAAYRDLGMYERAEALYRESLALRIERFGADDLTPHRARHNLAQVLYLQGRLDEARPLMEEAWTARRAALDASHPDLLRSEILAQLIELAEASSAEGMESLRGLIGALADALSDDNFGVLLARAELGRALIQAGDLGAARNEIEDAQRRLVETLNPEHAMALVLELDLARIEGLTGQAGLARERLGAQESAIHQRFPPESMHRRQWDCLVSQQFDVACWRASGSAR
ncbi:serine/threonine-protein kinase [Wenzhouxiangella marina]|uniref:Serine/threonine protein kinase n=1 Tax=Wenzhouxiangella marina TaxID=1579979 RepID=A0A0K0XU12_9GAMM|nr:serine/threonine-protein kinase [Wenzhouxiangella marina]AKS41111.1 Serine/threonine protein kinase [Wenzhouxiangella marina]MBB6087990.1 serine/threonine-protein kinase [Wenzhouxiangella marina]